MANISFNPAKITELFNGQVVSAVRELADEKMLKENYLKDFATLYDGTVFNKELSFVGEGTMIGKKGYPTGSNIANDDYEVKVNNVVFTPQLFSSRLSLTATDWNNTIAVLSMNKGGRYGDLTDTDIMNVVISRVVRSLVEAQMRMAFFSKTDVTVTDDSTTGDLKEGENKDYWNIIKGLFAQMEEQIQNNSKQGITMDIASNTKTIDTLEKLYFSADMVLRDQPDQIILCTQSFVDAYKKAIQKNGELETMLRNLENGKQRLTYQGVELVPLTSWDVLGNHFEESGAKAVYTCKSVLGIAMDTVNQMENFDIWYSNDQRTTFIDIAGKIDAKLLNKNLFTYAR